jgi:hypothetical protein
VVGALAALALAASCPPAPPAPAEHLLTRPRWLAGTVVTEYWPAPERWFSGRLVRAPGLAGRHRADWLYGAHGLPMEGEGIGLDGRAYHFAGPYSVGWVAAAGRATAPCAAPGYWNGGRPFWLSFGWRGARGQVTFPLAGGGWSRGRARRRIAPPPDLRFAPGVSRSLTYWRSAAVDPNLIPRGSRIFVAAYCGTTAHGWLRAEDTGGAIRGRHVDVFRPPPVRRSNGRLLRGASILVVPPGRRPRHVPRCPAA